MIILLGRTCSGKDKTVNELVKKHGYHQIITYATRPMRKGEKQDITYHYISEEEFKQKIDEGFFAEWKSYNTKFGTWYYGSALEDLKNADDNSVIILTPQGYRDVKNILSKKDIISIYLYANNDTIKRRLVKRGDNNDEAERRLKDDNKDFKGIENEVNKIVYNNDDTDINNVVDKILDIVKREK